MEISLDLSELTQFGGDLELSGRTMIGKVRPVVAKGALNVKNGMRDDMAASQHFGQAARSISYEMSGNAAYAEAKVGPTGGGAGSLANIAYFGGVHGGGGSVRDPQQVLNEEAPGFEAALLALLDDLA